MRLSGPAGLGSRLIAPLCLSGLTGATGRRGSAEREGDPLLLKLSLPPIVELMSSAVVDTAHANIGARLERGARLVDLTVDLSAAIAHDCPPVSHFRIAMMEPVWLRRVCVAAGDEVEVDAPIALFSTLEDEPLVGAAVRGARVTVMGILSPSLWEGATS